MLIYKITNLVNNKIYIGQTINSIKRRIGGYRDFYKKDTSSSKIHRAMRKYGFENFKFDVLHIVNTTSELNYLEKYLIRYYNTQNDNIGYNTEDGGVYRTMSEETKNKLSIINKEMYNNGWINPFQGKKHTEENKLKMSEDRKNNPKYIGSGRLGKKFGKAYNAKRVIQLDINGNFIAEYESLMSATIMNGWKKGGISAVCNKTMNTYKGFKWEFKNI